MHVDELPQIFRDCCHKANGRYAMTKPFASGGFIYATDGRICVRMPLVGELDGQEEGTKPDPSTVGWEGPFYSEASPVPELASDETVKCSCCNGRGEHDCGVGCEDCDCTGEIQIIKATKVGCVNLGNNYLRILAQHGAAIFMRQDGSHHKPVRFAGPGWEGLLMPRTEA
jgi:hypothetical protein